MNQHFSIYYFRCKPLLYLLILFTFRACSQPTPALGAHQLSIVNSGICSKDGWTNQVNPGAFIPKGQLTIGTSYSCPFLLKELQRQSFVVVNNRKIGQWSVGANFQQNGIVSSSQANVGYAIQLNEQLSVGVQLGGHFLSYRSYYRSSIQPRIGLGFVTRINELWHFGGSILYQKSATKNQYSSTIHTGFHYSPAPYLNCHFTFEKTVHLKGRLKLGLEYSISDQFQLSGGFASSPGNGAFGFSWKKKKCQLDTSFNYQPIIGWSPSIGVLFQSK